MPYASPEKESSQQQCPYTFNVKTGFAAAASGPACSPSVRSAILASGSSRCLHDLLLEAEVLPDDILKL